MLFSRVLFPMVLQKAVCLYNSIHFFLCCHFAIVMIITTVENLESLKYKQIEN